MYELFTDGFISEVIKLIFMILIGIVSIGFTKFLSITREKFNLSMDLEEFETLNLFIRDVVYSCVQTTNQTFVENLKSNNKFNKEKQEEAFRMTYSNVFKIVDDYLTIVLNTNDLQIKEIYLTNLIEEAVNSFKIEVPFIDFDNYLESDIEEIKKEN